MYSFAAFLVQHNIIERHRKFNYVFILLRLIFCLLVSTFFLFYNYVNIPDAYLL